MKYNNLIDGLLDIYTKAYYKYDNEDENKFRMIGNYVCRYTMERIYIRLLIDDEIKRMEELPKDKKEKYWRLANEFCKEDEQTKILAAKSAYTLELITSTF